MMSAAHLAGQLLVVGFPGQAIPTPLADSLRRGERGGLILFRPNIAPELAATAALVASAAALAPGGEPLLVGIDQEGGRVQRLGPPTLRVPPLATVGATGDAELARALGRRQGEELAALGVTMNFAPVLDVHTRPENPIIGDRSFGADAAVVARLGVAYGEGLEEGGVAPCGKHYPGHGDTSLDSHVELPRVDKRRDELEAAELVPFRAAARAGMAALMSAHVLYPALDPHAPATLSRVVSTEWLRGEIGFRGVLVSDDLEMGALRRGASSEDAHGNTGGEVPMREVAVAAVLAGCDLLLVCSRLDAQELAHDALRREIEESPAFRARCEEAYRRGLQLRQRRPPRPVTDARELAARIGGPASRELEERLAQAVARAAAKGHT